MPASPVTKPTQRSPRRACASQPCSVPSSASRPTAAPGGTAAGAGATGRPGAGPGSGRRQRADEAIPPPVHRLHILRRARRVPQRLPNLADTHHQGRLAHHGVGPGGLEQRLFRHQLARPVDEHGQHSPGLRASGGSPRRRATGRRWWRRAARPRVLSGMGRSLGRFRHGDALRTCLELAHVSLMTSPPPPTYIHAIRNGSTAQAYHAEEGR